MSARAKQRGRGRHPCHLARKRCFGGAGGVAGHVCGSRVRGGEFRFSVVVAGSLDRNIEGVASLLLWCQITLITIIIITIIIMQVMS